MRVSVAYRTGTRSRTDRKAAALLAVELRGKIEHGKDSETGRFWMRCDACHGEGKVKRRESEGPHTAPEMPCPECNGSGFAHCCDGMCEQPEDKRLPR
jgi:hypothetical protein